jgi:hypothetical protein
MHWPSNLQPIFFFFLNNINNNNNKPYQRNSKSKNLSNHGITTLLWFRHFIKQFEEGDNIDQPVKEKIVGNLELIEIVGKSPMFQISTVLQLFHRRLGLGSS